jgi:hypothetical protein
MKIIYGEQIYNAYKDIEKKIKNIKAPLICDFSLSSVSKYSISFNIEYPNYEIKYSVIYNVMDKKWIVDSSPWTADEHEEFDNWDDVYSSIINNCKSIINKQIEICDTRINDYRKNYEKYIKEQETEKEKYKKEISFFKL